jgi:glutamine synthetase
MQSSREYAYSQKNNLLEVFGSLTFSDKVMKKRLSKPTYDKLKKTIEECKPLDLGIADEIAKAMSKWAIELGCTHYTHWFQPMTGSTAEKHDAFIEPAGNETAVFKFTGSQLVMGEPDASSFPSGGLRETHEARGYTAWDTSSPVFIRDIGDSRTMCIPTSFFSYTGESLDKKTPLLRSVAALSEQATRLLKLAGRKKVKRVGSVVGPEQEYFLIDKEFYLQRPDLIATGRTLFGAEPARGQQLDDHYFGTIKPRILSFMNEMEEELYKLGVPAKTRHNEVAPGQYELAIVHSASSKASDHNLLTMELMEEVADRHDLACLLHEKPFAGLNGNGKHNNWSMGDDLGNNLLEPGKTPEDNKYFLLSLTAVIRAVDRYNDLIRACVAKPGNDHRLGANEAPPAIMSIFLGDQLTAVVDSLTTGKPIKGAEGDGTISIGLTQLPPLPKDTTDRNRTSPFAFTGNKFEFRAVGSSQSLTTPNVVINTIVAESLDFLSTEIEKLTSKGTKINDAIHKVVTKTLKAHKRIIFNGNNYAESWHKEAKKRGLSNLISSIEAMPVFGNANVVKLFDTYDVLSPRESQSRVNVQHDLYAKKIGIEAKLTADMAKTIIIPAALQYQNGLAETINITKQALGAKAKQTAQQALLIDIVSKVSSLKTAIDGLEAEIVKVEKIEDEIKLAQAYGKKVIPHMEKVRGFVDALEVIVDDDLWPLPKYREMLFIH